MKVDLACDSIYDRVVFIGFRMRKIFTLVFFALSIGVLFFVGSRALVGDFTNIYSFTTSNEYRGIYIIRSSNKIYGVTSEGGQYNNGSIFSLNSDGTDFQVLKSFNILDSSYGWYPYGGLIEYNSKLYGTTMMGGTDDLGTLFSIDKDGSNYTVVRSFGPYNTGTAPSSTLIEDNGVFYGATNDGGAGYGVIYSVNTDGLDYTNLHSFLVGGYPTGSLLLIGDTLYGLTYNGGANNKGVVFSINKNGDDYTILHSFAGGVGDGQYPYGALVIYNNRLYGTTNGGGSDGSGTIFAIDPDGTDYAVIHHFIFDTSGYPYGGLVAYEDKLYGTTDGGGTEGNGTVYRIDPDGSNFTVLYNCVASDYCKYLDSIDAPFIYNGMLYSASSHSGSGVKGAIFTLEIDDVILPTISNISPTNGAYPDTKSPLVSFALSENGDCRASTLDESYDDMSNDVDCTGDGTTSISCQLPNVGSVTAMTFYFACQDNYSNKDSSITNTSVTYNWALPTVTPTVRPTSRSYTYTPTPSVTLSLEASPTITVMVTKLPQTGSQVKITIIGPDGMVLANASVQIDNVTYKTDNTGAILAKDLKSGAHEIKFIKDGNTYTQSFVLAVSDIQKGITVTINNTNPSIISYVIIALLIGLLIFGAYKFIKRN